MNVVEICAGAGGQALGLESAGFKHELLVEIDTDACNTLRLNRPNWTVENIDIRQFNAGTLGDVSLLAGGVPCPPFSIAGKKQGKKDERDLFPEALRIVSEIKPQAVMLENVKGILDRRFQVYREEIETGLRSLGYDVMWKLLDASEYGVSQKRPRVVLVALLSKFSPYFFWPQPMYGFPAPVGELLKDLMGENGWNGLEHWVSIADKLAPTIVGGSKKHGGPDLGPTRAKEAWLKMGVNGKSLADAAPSLEFEGPPRLTNRMVARLQGFPDDWKFFGRKTTVYRQIGNAFPPPVAREIGISLKNALSTEFKTRLAG